MTWLDQAIDLAKQFEGCELEAYPDPMYGWRRASIGFGATGPAIVQGVVWTQAQADADLVYRMNGIGAHIDELVTVPITDDQKAALCDLAYNIGLGAFEKSTLLACVNVNHMQGAADQFAAWNKSNGVVLNGLVKRRAAEKDLFTGKSQPQPEESQ